MSAGFNKGRQKKKAKDGAYHFLPLFIFLLYTLLEVNGTRPQPHERRTSVTNTGACKMSSQLPGFIVISIH